MQAIVRIALQRPYTFIVMSMMIFILGVLSAIRMPVDIFPSIRVPVIAAVWQYSGMPPQDMTALIMNQFQRSLTSTVNNIEHIEAQTYTGIGVGKIFFQPGADITLANAQVTAIVQNIVKFMPQGALPPLIINYDASTVPILQLALSGKGLTEQQLADLAMYVIRNDLTSVPGATIPYPYGGRLRQIQVDLNPVALQSKGLSAQDVALAMASQNQTTPAGAVKIGKLQYNVKLNNRPVTLDDLNDLPVKTVNGATIYMRDVAHVRDGSLPQQNVVHVNGTRSVLMTILKAGATSTLSVVENVKARLPTLAEILPENLKIVVMNDQSVFVSAAISGVIYEGILAAALTSLMILLFLGSWRSTAIIAISIPLSILAAICLLTAFGQTFNIMTLGGLALAVGILVDDATVTIENINWHLEKGKDVITSILDGAQQIVVPAFVSLLCICIVFVPMFFLPGVAGFLFVPLAMSVVFAMVASFVLSRTLLPTMAMYLLKPHTHDEAEHLPQNKWQSFQRSFTNRFENLRERYSEALQRALNWRKPFILTFIVCVLASFLLTPFLGQNLFPTVDAGSITLHVRAPVGTRIEETSALLHRIQKRIREIIPADELTSMADNIGMPNSAINTTYISSGVIGPSDGDILIGLTKGHAPTSGYVKRLREVLPREFPTATFSFLPSDMVSQILNFGAPAPIDVQVVSRNIDEAHAYARRILREMKNVPGIADARIQQSLNAPQLRFDVDRSHIGRLGLTERDVTISLGTALAGTSQTAPVFWVEPKTGISYQVVLQTPEYKVDTLSELQNLPVTATAPGVAPQVLGGISTMSRATTDAVVSQYNIQTMVNIFATTQGRDLGGVAGDVMEILEKLAPEKPKGLTVNLRGQYPTMTTAFTGLGFGLLAAIVMIYLLIVINFQSWLDPFVIITALPGALAGIIWTLFITDTTLSVPALTGAIMCMGVSTANSILLVSFARERLEETGDAARAALEAGFTRFRPVLMTALAMIIGMSPMALGLGEGGEQNAPLGRAVIGGLLVATFATLMLVPVIFAVVHDRARTAPTGEAHA